MNINTVISILKKIFKQKNYKIKTSEKIKLYIIQHIPFAYKLILQDLFQRTIINIIFTDSKIFDNRIDFIIENGIYVNSGYIEHSLIDINSMTLIKSYDNLFQSIELEDSELIKILNNIYYNKVNKENNISNNKDINNNYKFLLSGNYSRDILMEAYYYILYKRKNITYKFLLTVFKKFRLIYGPNEITSTLANMILKDASADYNIKMYIASYFCETGEYQKSIDIVKNIKKMRDDVLIKNRYLALNALLYSEKIVNDQLYYVDYTNFFKLKNNIINFENFIRKNRDNLCIVGNSPCELNTGNGSLIDTHNCIVRFNSSNTYYNYNIDYGSKTNIVVLNTNYYQVNRIYKNFDFLILSDSTLYSTKNISQKIYDFEDSINILTFPENIIYELIQTIGSSPSSGIKLLFYIYKLIGPLCKDSLYGFSFVDQKIGEAKNYDKLTRHLPTIHNWDNEYALFKYMMGV